MEEVSAIVGDMFSFFLTQTTFHLEIHSFSGTFNDMPTPTLAIVRNIRRREHHTGNLVQAKSNVWTTDDDFSVTPIWVRNFLLAEEQNSSEPTPLLFGRDLIAKLTALA